MTISLDAEKAFDKIQHPFIIKKKKTQKTKNRGEFPQLGKKKKKETIANLSLHGEKPKASPLRSGMRQE